MNEWLRTETDEPDDEPESAPSPNDVHIARTPFGDWYAFRTDDPLLPADARIIHWDHDTFAPAEEWPTISAFIAFLIDRMNRGAVGDDQSP